MRDLLNMHSRIVAAAIGLLASVAGAQDCESTRVFLLTPAAHANIHPKAAASSDVAFFPAGSYSTAYTTSVVTIYGCSQGVDDCPVTTIVVPVSTTVCPVTITSSSTTLITATSGPSDGSTTLNPHPAALSYQQRRWSCRYNCSLFGFLGCSPSQLH
jgi:hypothetical protein